MLRTTSRPATIVVAALLGLLASTPPAATRSEASATAAEVPASFVNHVWRVAESSGVAPGQLYVFLSEGTLVIASEHGKPSLGKWSEDAGGLTMIEEGIAYRVEILELTPGAFRIRSHHPHGFVDIRFVPAEEWSPAERWAASRGVLSGSVAYRERLALPPDAVVEVWITDVSPLVMNLSLVTEATIPTQGRQVPILFELRYDPSRILADHSYAVRAAIKSGGEILFVTAGERRVITMGNPTHVDLWLVRPGSEADSRREP